MYSNHHNIQCTEPIVHVGSKSSDKDSSSTDVKKLTQEKFLEMLKNGKQTAGSVKTAEANAAASRGGSAEEGAGWNAIRDDYMLGKKISMKVGELWSYE